MDGTYMTNGELAAIQVESSINEKLEALIDEVRALKGRVRRLEMKDVRFKNRNIVTVREA